MLGYAKAVESGRSDGTDKEWVPPISMMGIVASPTHRIVDAADQSLQNQQQHHHLADQRFWGGAVTERHRAFAQVTYNAPPAGGFPDPFGHTWTWDNTDIRFARAASLAGFDFIYGITANNSPTVQDVWNTTPAWAFPYAASTIAPTPASKTLIEGAFAAHVGGVGAYTFINDMLYLEASAYRTLGFRQQNAVGVDPFGAPGLLDGSGPYWRVAFEPQWGPHSLMVGPSACWPMSIHGSIHRSRSAPWAHSPSPTSSPIRVRHAISVSRVQLLADLRASYIREFQKLDSTFLNGGRPIRPTS